MFAATRMERLGVILAVALSVATWKPAPACDDDPDAGEGSGTAASDEVTDAVERGIEYLNTDFARNALLSNERLWLFTDRDSSIGVDVAPMSAALRSQLGLTDDRGVVVNNVDAEGPGAQAGIQVHDVLLSAGGKPVNSAAALQENTDAAGEEAIAIILMRGGKRMSLEVTPSGPDSVWVDSLVRSYWIGITADAADDALRAQLAVPEGRGLVVTEVYDESAAAAAGIEVHDVLLEFVDAPLSSVEELNRRIQEVGGEPATVKLIRGGDELTLKVTPRAREGGGGMLWVYDASRSMQNLPDFLTRSYGHAGWGEFNAGNPELKLTDLYNQNRLYEAGENGALQLEVFDPRHRVRSVLAHPTPGDLELQLSGQPESQTIEQRMQGLIEEARALLERMRALEESIRPSVGAGEATDPQAESGEGGASEGEQE